MALISLRNIHLAFGVAPILDGVDFNLFAGERVCLIGRNGEGKSTLFKLINGSLKPDRGEIIIQNGLTVAMLAQDVPDNTASVLDTVMAGAGDIAAVLAEYHNVADACTAGDMAACTRMSELSERLDAEQGWDVERQALKLIDIMGLTASDLVSSLSGGRKRRVLLAAALMAKPDILLLDEPTNHLDVESILWLEEYLLGSNVTLLFITHDRAFVDKLATRIIELDRGALRSYDVVAAKGKAYARYLELKAAQLEAEEKANANFDKKLAEEEVWIRQGIKARRTRNEGRVRALKALREERKARRNQVGDINISMNDTEKSGKLVFKVKNLKLAFGEQTLVNGFSTTVMRGDKIGIIGANGVGKSTLINAILQTDTAQAGVTKTGSIKHGTNIEIAYLDQLRDQLDLEQSVAYNVSAGSDYIEVAGKEKHILSYLQDFLFSPERARTPVKALSGGEKNRVLLAKQLLKSANVLVLDEPTNDLDMATLELLEEAVTNFEGTVLLISHDRAFMDNVVTSTWVFEGDGVVREYVGGYQDYVRQRPKSANPSDSSAMTSDHCAEVTSSSRIVSQNTAHLASDTHDNVSDAPQDTSTSPTSTSGKKKKLSYNEQRELEALPREIDALEKEQITLQDKLADGSWFSEDLKAATAATQRLDEIDRLLLQKLERWDALEG